MNAVDRALYAALSGSTALTSLLAGGTADPSVFQFLAPEGADPPYVIYAEQAGTPAHVFTGVAFENEVYLVKAVTLGPSAALAGTIATTIDQVLADQPLTVSGYANRYLRRVSNVDYPEVTSGQRYHHRGATYRVLSFPA